MLPDEVREAVDHIDTEFSMGLEPFESTEDRTEFMDQRCFYVGYWEWIAIRAHLLAREAEVEGMRTLLDLLRTDKSGTRRDYVESRAGTMVRITAHLSENSRG